MLAWNNLFLAAALAFLVSPFASLEAGAPLEFKYGAWSLTLDSGSGAWLALKRGDSGVLSNPEAIPSVDLKVGKSWLSESSSPKLVKAELDQSSGVLKSSLSWGDWNIVETARFSPDAERPRMERQASWSSNSKDPVKFHGFAFNAVVGHEGRYLFPMTFFYDASSNWSYPTIKNPSADMDGEWRRTGPLSKLPEGDQMRSMHYCNVALANASPDLSLVLFADTRMDGCAIVMKRVKDASLLRWDFQSKGWCEPGQVQTLGSAWMELYKGPLEDALAAVMPKMIQDLGLGVPKDRPDWVRDASIFGFMADHFADDRFADLVDIVPARAASLGANAMWMLPVQYGTVNYCPVDYYKLEPKRGTWEDYKAFVAKLHEKKIRLLQDIVPHGYGQTAAIYRGNPMTDMVFTENGDILSGRAFDMLSPSWRKYMGDVASFYVRELGVDGFRIDAPSSMSDNWRRAGFPSKPPGVVSYNQLDKKIVDANADWWKKTLEANGGALPPLPYARASSARASGTLAIVEAIRSSALKAKPDSAALLEFTGLAATSSGDLCYDFYFPLIPLKLQALPPSEFVKRLSLWLEEQRLCESPGAVRMRYPTTGNDNLDSQLFLGFEAQSALTSLSFLAQGAPMYFNSMNVGHGDHIRRLNELRDAVPSLRRGEAFYRLLKPSDPKVFAVLRKGEGSSAVGLINFSPENVDLEIPLADAIENYDAKKSLQREIFAGKTLASTKNGVKLGLRPWETAVIAFDGEAPKTVVAGNPPAVDSDDIPRVSEKDGAIDVSCRAYALSIDAKSGLVKAFSDAARKPLLGPCDLLCDPSSAKPSKAAISLSSEKGLPLVKAVYSFDGGASVELNYLCRPDGVRVEAKSSKADLASLLFPFASAKDYQIDSAEGMYSDRDLDGVLKTRPLQRVGISRFPTDGRVLWNSTQAPLDMNRPELRFLSTDGTSSCAVRFAAVDGVPFPYSTLISSFDSKPGLDLVVSLASDSSFEMLPSTVRKASVQGEAFQLGSLRVVNESLGWRIENGHYAARILRTGGVLAELRDKTGRPLLESQDLFSEAGFKGKTFIDAKSDIETELSISREGKSLKFVFLSELRSASLRGQTKYPVQARTEYSFDESELFSIFCSFRTLAPSESPASIRWRAFLPKGVSVKREGDHFTGRVDSSSAFFLRVISQEGPLKLEDSFDKDSLRFDWRESAGRRLTTGVWQSASLYVWVGRMFKMEAAARRAPVERPLDDGSFERRGSRFSLAKGARVPFSPYERAVNPFWVSQFSSYMDFGSGRDGGTAFRMNIPAPSYCQTLHPFVLEPGSYKLRFSMKVDRVDKGRRMPFSASLECRGQDGRTLSVSKDFECDAPGPWKDFELVLPLPQGGEAPQALFGGKGSAPQIDDASVLLDDIVFEKIPSNDKEDVK